MALCLHETQPLPAGPCALMSPHMCARPGHTCHLPPSQSQGGRAEPRGHQGNHTSHLYHHLKGEDACEDVVHVLKHLEPKGKAFLKGEAGSSSRGRSLNDNTSAWGLWARVWGGEGRPATPEAAALPPMPGMPRSSVSPAPPRPDGSTHVVPGRVCLHRVLSSQGDAAQGNDHEDAHLEVPHGHDVMAEAAEPERQSTGHLRPTEGWAGPSP